MYAVIFEVEIKPEYASKYLELAAVLREEVKQVPGFISVERFSSLSTEGKLVSLSYWEDAAAIAEWKANMKHQSAQQLGIAEYFKDFTIRVANIEREYSLSDRLSAR